MKTNATFPGPVSNVDPEYAGDQKWMLFPETRLNNSPGQMVFGVLMQLEHNRLCGQFRDENPDWDEETLFQEARRWNIAFYQKMTIRDYLAPVIGEALPPYEGYKPDVNPEMDIFFSTVSFQYAHSKMKSIIPRLSAGLSECPFGDVLVRDILFMPASMLASKHQPINEGVAQVRDGS